MTTLEAIEKRISRRSYLNEPLDKNQITFLQSHINKLNKDSGLSIQFIEDGSYAFHGFMKSYGMFHGVQSFFALVGKEDDIHLNEKVGYYGEKLVLEATKLGLGTCWVGGTYDKKHCPCTLQDHEILVCVITVGKVEDKQTFKEKTVYKLAHRKTKPIEELYKSDVPVPDWFLQGIKAVGKAPSAVNRQPVTIRYQSDDKITASVASKGGYLLIDLGIAKLHFEAAAGGRFDLGNGADYKLTSSLQQQR
ncbi:MAG: Nitroreductase family protein [Herbinix sp.]|nr:Nitroreductase family protein [Herbinix sp.]